MSRLFADALINAVGEDKLLFDEPLAHHTTFRTGGPAAYYAMPSSAVEIADLIKVCRDHGTGYYILGNGSNVLASDDGYDGLVIEIGRNMSEIRVEDDIIYAQAGAMLSAAAAAAAAASLAGLEFASGIPGSVGGAVFMNAGAYGGEIKDVLKTADVLTSDGRVITLEADELDLSYRHSCVEEKGYTVISAAFAGRRGDKEEIMALMKDLNGRRRDKQPLEYPSAGSTFKRPEGHYAGALIEECGLKGASVGGAQVSTKHAGFVINTGGATSADIIGLISHIKDTVYRETGVMLEPEVRMLGFGGAEI